MSAPGSGERGTRYRFERRLASGGMADLFVAEASAAGGVRKRVAIKRIQPRHAADAEFTEMFVREARLLSTLQHPNIVQTYDVLQVRGEYFIVMELLEGCDLQQFRKRIATSRVPFFTSHALYVVDRVLSALHYAHERVDPDGVPLGITHRDVAPDNVYLTKQGGVKLLDFGIAKAQAHLDPDREGGGEAMIKGKVGYMAPEQCQTGEIDRRADIYAVGVLLYRLLSGELPHKGKNPYDTMRAVIHDAPRPLRELVPDLPADLTDLVMRAMAKRPGDRPQTARDLQLELLQVVKNNHYYVTDLEFTALVEQVFAAPFTVSEVPAAEDLPADLVVGAEDPATPAPEAPAGVVVSTDAATLERLEGVLVLRMRGSIDERMPWQAILPHLVGDVLLDTEHVTRISSFGVRGLLSLLEKGRGRATFHHVRASVPFLQQAAMVRALLGEGRVLSFFLPYTDPDTGAEFRHLVQGPEGAALLASQRPPEVPSPGSGRPGRFDEDAESYLGFGGAYEPVAPPAVRAAVAVLDGDGARPIDKSIDAQGTHVRVRRPLTAELRWARLLRGVEGALTLDLEQVPLWDDAGVADLREALRRARPDLVRLDLLGLTQDLHEKIVAWPEVAGLPGRDVIRIGVSCRECNTPRQVLADPAALEALRAAGTWEDPCPRCDGRLAPVRPLPAPRGGLPEKPKVPEVAPLPKAFSAPPSLPPPPDVPAGLADRSIEAAALPIQPPPPDAVSARLTWLLVGAVLLLVGGSVLLLLVAIGANLT